MVDQFHLALGPIWDPLYGTSLTNPLVARQGTCRAGLGGSPVSPERLMPKRKQDMILRLFFTLLPLSPAKKMQTRCCEHLCVLCHLDYFLVFLSSWFVAFLFFIKFSKKNQRFFEFNHATLNMTNDVR
jgi:hypothetical protein